MSTSIPYASQRWSGMPSPLESVPSWLSALSASSPPSLPATLEPGARSSPPLPGLAESGSAGAPGSVAAGPELASSTGATVDGPAPGAGASTVGPEPGFGASARGVAGSRTVSTLPRSRVDAWPPQFVTGASSAPATRIAETSPAETPLAKRISRPWALTRGGYRLLTLSWSVTWLIP